MKIIIQTDADFTPKGKRTARVIRTDRGGQQLRWYVGGKIYARRPVTAQNVDITNEWLAA